MGFWIFGYSFLPNYAPLQVVVVHEITLFRGLLDSWPKLAVIISPENICLFGLICCNCVGCVLCSCGAGNKMVTKWREKRPAKKYNL